MGNRYMAIEFENYYCGTSGLLLPVPNKLHYPEQFRSSSRLHYYASMRNSIEINSSFYRIPLYATVKRWADDVNDRFRFTFKLSREFTHNRDLAFDPEAVGRFFGAIAGVGEKKGCLLVQLPPSVRIGHIAQLGFLLSGIRGNDPDRQWNVAVEFRHPSLYVEQVYDLLERHGMGMVVHDKSPAGTPFIDHRPGFVYLRFHGPEGDYRGSYGDGLLWEFAGYINNWLAGGKKVFAYFNNTMGGAQGNLETLSRMVRGGA